MNRDALLRELDIVEKEKLNDKYVTALQKAKFASELKAGLGDKIKKNPNGVRLIKKPWYKKLGLWLKNIFTKF
jgi:hypothetical protein